MNYDQVSKWTPQWLYLTTTYSNIKMISSSNLITRDYWCYGSFYLIKTENTEKPPIQLSNLVIDLKLAITQLGEPQLQ